MTHSEKAHFPSLSSRLDAVRESLPIDRLYPFREDVGINFQLNRFLIATEVDLFASIARHIADVSDWKPQFLAAARAAEGAGSLATAAQLYRAAEFYMDPQDADRNSTYVKFMDLFYRSEATAGFERAEVTYGSITMHAISLQSTGTRRGAIVLHGGFDSYLEEFLDIARAFGTCGYDVVLFDGPGQGTTLMQHGHTMTPDWDRPVGAVIDHFGLDDVTLIGVSLGGCLALRAAAAEPRVTRVVAWDAMLDFFDTVTAARGRALQRLISTLLSLKLTRILDSRTKTIMAKDFAARWGIEQGMHVTGSSKPSQFFEALRRYNTFDVSPRIRQHVLVMAGAEDHFVPAGQFHKQVGILTGARSVSSELFTAAEDAQSHCQVGNQSLSVGRIAQWIEGHPR